MGISINEKCGVVMQKLLVFLLLLFAAGCTNKGPGISGEEKKLCSRIIGMDSEFDSVFVKTREIELNTGPDNFIGWPGKAEVKKNKVYVSSSNPAAIYVLGMEGNLITKIGEKGNGPGEYALIRDFDVDDDGNIYILDTQNSRVSVFSNNNAFLRSFQIKYSTNICTDNKGGYFLYNSGAASGSGINVISHFDKEGKQVKEFCPVFSHALIMGGAIISGADDNIYISNVSTYLVRKYSQEGELLGEYKDASTIFKELDVKGRIAAPEELRAIFILTGIAAVKNNLVITEYTRPEPKGKWNDIYFTDGTLLKRGIKVNEKFGLRVISDDENLYYIEKPDTGGKYNAEEKYNYKISGFRIKGEK